MPRLTPFHPRTSALSRSWAYKEWSGYVAPCNYDAHSEREYFAFRHSAGLIDVTPLYKYDLTGPDAGTLLSRVWAREAGAIGLGRVVYGTMCDAQGKALDDGTVARLRDRYRMTSSERWYGWMSRHARGLDVHIEDTTDRIAALALQGPRARAILDPIVDLDLGRMRFFRVRRTKLDGLPVTISRTGYTGDLGYEVWCDNEHALAVWDAIVAAGSEHGLEPAGLDALDVARLEAGFVLQGIDYISARRCSIESRKSTPTEAGLGWTVDLDRAPFIGQRALRAERRNGSTWALVGLELSWTDLEQLYDEHGLPPHLAPVACRLAVPIYDRAGRKQVGQMTSSTWSPLLKKYIGIGQVYAPFGATGTIVSVEHTVEFHRRRVRARVVDRPFFDPDRKRSTTAQAEAGAS